MSAIVVSPTDENPRLADAINRLAQGGSNAIGTFTLTASTTSTTISSVVCSPQAYVFATPLNSHAANDQALMSIVAGVKQFVITHANNSRTDRTFGYVVLS
jgi:hypothetical protein